MIKMHFRFFFLLVASVFSQIAMAIEEPTYEVLESDGPFEVRRYAPMLVAESYVEGDMHQASNKGFRLIADFIFGNNQSSDANQKSRIAMTAPVTVEPLSPNIAMTTPVTVQPQSVGMNPETASRWRVQFVMPSQYTLASIPKPVNEAVQLREIPVKYYVVHKFSWLNTQTRVGEKEQETLQWARQRSLQPLGRPQLARYDPPWTLPMFKRNEILLEIEEP